MCLFGGCALRALSTCAMVAAIFDVSSVVMVSVCGTSVLCCAVVCW